MFDLTRRKARVPTRREVFRDLGLAVSGAMVLPSLGITAAAAAVSGSPHSLLVPAYFHTSQTADWAAVADSRAGTVVFNVDSGVGTSRSREFASVVERVADAGVFVLGYVDTAYGTRPAAAVQDELLRYRSWYGVRGAFFDQVSTGPGHVSLYNQLATMARSNGSERVVFNHGTYPDPAYAGLADLLVAFEGTWSTYQGLEVPAWALEMSAERFCHLVYATPPGNLATTVQRAGKCNADVVYVTDRNGTNPWDTLPSYFENEMSLVSAT